MHNASTPLHWGIIGPGIIAKRFVEALAGSPRHLVAAVSSRNQQRAEAFARRHALARAYGDVDALLRDPAVDAVYVATPHPAHAAVTMAAVAAGKHVLCEKPMALSAAEAQAVFASARAHGQTVLEGWMFRFHPLMARVVELLSEIGDVRAIHARFGRAVPFDGAHRLFDRAQGGGVLLDIGGYPVAFANMVANACLDGIGRLPGEVRAAAQWLPGGVDGHVSALLNYGHAFTASVEVSLCADIGAHAEVIGSIGSLHVPNPWAQTQWPGFGEVRLTNSDGEAKVERVAPDVDPYLAEADALVSMIRDPDRGANRQHTRFSIGVLQTLDRIRHAVGLSYPGEPLEASNEHPSPKGAVVAKTLADVLTEAPIVLGVDKPMDRASAWALFDAFASAGGRVFDTARFYGDAEYELGAWLRRQPNASDFRVITKVAHTPHDAPEHVLHQLAKSRETLGMDCLDAVLLHRDNRAIPVADWIDVLEEARARGWVATYGASNWTVDRLEAARQHKGGRGMAMVSNHYALARWQGPLWPGCETAHAPAFQQWLEHTATPLLAWGSQAQGFFAVEQPANATLASRWYTDDNLEIRRRVRHIATTHGVSPNVVALRWLITRPYAVYPVIGPEAPAQVDDSMKALVTNLDVRDVAGAR